MQARPNMQAGSKNAKNYQDAIVEYNKKFGQDVLTPIEKEKQIKVLVHPDFANFINNEKLTTYIPVTHDINEADQYYYIATDEMIKSPAHRQALDYAMLRNNIDILRKSNSEVKVDNDVILSLDALSQALKDAPANESNRIVMQHYLDVTADLIKNPKPAPITVERDIENLAKALRSKPPLSARIVAAIAGFVGAVLGFGIGVTVGALVTHGIGALPAGIAAAFKGFTLGTKLGIAGAAIGLPAGAAIGFFRAKEKEQQSKTDKLFATNQTNLEVGTLNDRLMENSRPKA